MIRIIKGTYTAEAPDERGVYQTMAPGSAPFEQSPEKEAELVEKGAAVYVEAERKSGRTAAGAAAGSRRKKTGEASREP